MLALLLQAASPAVPPPAPAEDDVVVLGRRLGTWRGRIVSNPLWTRCRTTQSTGDAAIDGVGCAAMSACWPDARPNYVKVEDKHRDVAERQRIKAETDAAFGACIPAKRATLIADLAARGHQAAGDAR